MGAAKTDGRAAPRAAAASERRQPAALSPEAALSVRRLSVRFPARAGSLAAVEEVSFDLRAGETTAIVGESGSGKSLTCLSLLGLVDPPGRVEADAILFRRREGGVVDLSRADERLMRRIRGDEIGMIFQEPMTSLNPIYTIGEQIGETIRAHRSRSRAESRDEAKRMLELVGISDPARRLEQYPHELSGGMRQRALIAIALCCEPNLLIADEATTALDVTVQAQILDLLSAMRERRHGLSILLVTHDMGVVAEAADSVIVMYGGRIVEEGDVRVLLRAPRHPYTRGLLASLPRRARGRFAGAREPLIAIPGQPPHPSDRAQGCAFAPRCAFRAAVCDAPPPLVEAGPGHRVRCARAELIAP